MLNKKSLLTIVAAVAGAVLVAPMANAETGFADVDGSSVEFSDGTTNAAAAVVVQYEEGAVSSLSASSAFGESGAAAAATSDNALSVGSSQSNGSLESMMGDEEGPGSFLYVDFGSFDD